MNFGYKKTMEKRIMLTSLQRKFSTKILVTAFKFCIYLILITFVTGGFFVIGMAKGIIDNAPDINDISIAPASHSTTVYDSDGNKIEELVTSGSNRVSVTLDKIPEHLRWAVVCTEDERFYQHNGIDLKGILRAGYRAISSFNLSEGASTITQQLLKNNVFTDWVGEQTYGSLFKRKLQEQYLAIQVEKEYTKDDILTNYLNTINLGANTLGVQMASQRYFRKNVEDLTLSESAVIAGITQNPYKYNPINFPEKNAERRKTVLDNMLRLNKITEEEYTEAMQDDVYSRIHKYNRNVGSTSPYSYFIDELIEQVQEDLVTYKGYTKTQAYNALYSGGLNIYTTQDTQIQEICDKEFQDDNNFPTTTMWSIDWAWSVESEDGTITNYSQSYISYYHRNVLNEKDFKLLFYTKEEAQKCVDEYKKAMLKNTDTEIGERISFTIQPQASFVVMDQATGYVKAIVGGRGKKESSLTLNRATNTTRQPGSTFKILAAYAPAIDAKGYTLSTVIVDEPYTYSNGRPVSNWWGDWYRGALTLRSAIALSANICAVKTITDITPELAFEYLQNFGFTTLVVSRELADGSVIGDIGQAMALGGLTDGVTNLELTAAYAAIANSGVYTKPVFYTKIVDHNGKVILDNTTPTTHTVIKQTTAYYLTQAMEDVVSTKAGGTGTAAAIPNMHVAGKTGTTSSEYDLWFAGFTPYLTASIWTGYDENTGLGNGVWHNALWSKIMKQIHDVKGYEDKDFPVPGEWTPVEICDQTGKVATEGICTSTHTEYFEPENVPTVVCSGHGSTWDSQGDDGVDNSSDDDQ